MSWTGVRLYPRTKSRLETLGGQDYTIDEVVNMLIDDFIDFDEDDDQMSLSDFEDDEDEE
jgi:hypothetical protein